MKRLIFLVLILTGCTNANLKQLTTYGSQAHIMCFSGNVLIYEGDSTGKVSSESHSDGWFFEDAKTHKLMRISGACIIEN